MAPEIGLAKVGLELFVGGGPSVVSAVRESGLDVFLDLKLCDIPATVAGAVRRAVALDVRLLTVHALGGGEMLAAAVAAAADTRTTIVAVTILTSLDAADLDALGITGDTGEAVERLGRLAWRAGVRAFVCSPGELGRLRADLGRDALLITPGIRPAGSDATADQKRVATPAASMAAGANLLVVGRPIRDAADPASAARAVVREIAAALERAS